jgi:hypothetical protein
MIITEPSAFVVHDRLPVILEPDQFDAYVLASMGETNK